MGASSAPDPRVRVFAADRRTSWRRFRLGEGLNVVVVNPNLPREVAWRFPTGSISSSPTVMGTTVLVTANDHHLYAIDGATGGLVWKFHAENEIMSQPSYLGNLIYVTIGDSANVVYNPPDYSVIGAGMNKLEAIDAKTGIEQWWDGLDGSGMPTSAIVGRDLIDADGQGTVLSTRAANGAYLWHVTLPSVFAMSSVVDGRNGSIYLSGRASNAVFALDAKNGATIWRHTLNRYDGGIGDDPLALQDHLLVGDYLQPTAPGPFGWSVTVDSHGRQHVYAIDARNGRLAWDTLLPGVAGLVPPYNESAVALIYGNSVYVGSAVAPIVSALDLHTGKLLWQVRVDGAVKGGIAALDGVLYFGDHAGAIWAVNAKTGRVLGHVHTDMQFNTGSPIIVNDTFIEGGLADVIALPLANVRNSRPMTGVTTLSVWQRLARVIVNVLPHRDPHREAAYYRTR
jgi:outer membrane protein assembly factor BamB